MCPVRAVASSTGVKHRRAAAAAAAAAARTRHAHAHMSHHSPGDILRACASASATTADDARRDTNPNVPQLLERMRASASLDVASAADGAQDIAALATVTLRAASRALSGVRATMRELELGNSSRRGRGVDAASAQTISTSPTTKAKTTSRLAIADEGEFPSLSNGSNAGAVRSLRRNLATALDAGGDALNCSADAAANELGALDVNAIGGEAANRHVTMSTSGGDVGVKPRRVAPTPVAPVNVGAASRERPPSGATSFAASAHRPSTTSGASPSVARRIAPTMVSRPLDMDGSMMTSNFKSTTTSGAATPSASTPSSVATSPNSSKILSRSASASTPLTVERMYVRDVKSPPPVALSPALENLAALHAAALAAGYPLDLSPELAGLCQLLGVPGELEVADADIEVEGEDVSTVMVRTGREAHAYACAVLSGAPSLVCALGESMLETLAESSILATHAATLHGKLVKELGTARVVSSECERAYDLDARVGAKLYGFDLLDALAKADAGVAGRTNLRGGRVVSLAEQQVIEHNRERIRDAFYALVRASTSRAQGLGQDVSIASRAKALIANTHPANIRWLADLFVARLSQSSAVGETDEELGKSITPAKLSRLHERIIGSSSNSQAPNGAGRGGGRGGRGRAGGRGGRGDASTSAPIPPVGAAVAPIKGFGSEAAKEPPSFAGLFPPAQQPYVRFIETTDSHKFCTALQRSLIAALHALDPNSVPAGEDNPSRESSSAGQTERMLAAHAMGSFLGVLTFGVAAGSTVTASPSTASPVQGIDLVCTLKRATARGELVVSAPWVLAFIRFVMWDEESLRTPHYVDTLAYLRALAASPHLKPSNLGFNAVRMCLRAVLANGLSVAAPVTTAQANAWTANSALDVAAPPPPPLAIVPALPPTTSQHTRAHGDPLDAWGAQWVRSASANASARANNQDGALESPSREELRAASTDAPDLSRVGVDRRYVETVCPSVDRAIKTIKQREDTARALRERVNAPPETTSNARANAETPSLQPAGAPRRVQAQPQTRVEPTSVINSTSHVRAFGSIEPASDLSPTFGVVSPSTAARPPPTFVDAKSSSSEIKHALQRAFLQNLPGLRRLVDFAVDAATLAAVDDATAAVTADAVTSARASVSAAANVAAHKVITAAQKKDGVATLITHSHAVIEDAWTPEFERAVERAAMAATREVIASVAATAAQDAGARAAAAVAALSGAGNVRNDATTSTQSRAATRAACGVAADAASFAAADRVRRNLPFELHARIASDARRLLKAALNAAKTGSSATGAIGGTVVDDDVKALSAMDADYASIAASAIASAFASASKWPAGSLLAECSSLRRLANTGADALALARSITAVVECIKRVLEQDVKFSRAQMSRKKPIISTRGGDKPVPDSRPGEKLAATLALFARAYIKLLLAAPQNALSKTTKAKTAEDGWGIARDEVCAGATSALVSAFRAAAPALDLVAALAPPDAPNPWRRVYAELFAFELWIGPLREFPESPFAQKRIELVFADALVELPRRRAACEAFAALINDASKRVGLVGYALCIRAALRFTAAVVEKSTFDAEDDAPAVAAFASVIRERCVAAGEHRLARRALASLRALESGAIYANIKTVTEPP